MRSGPISSVERSHRPCPRPSAGARVILRWRHAPSTRCRSMRRRRGRFAGGACGVELSRQTTLNSLRRRASKFSFVRLHDRVKRVIGGSCAWVYLPVARKVCRPEQHGTGVSVTLPGSDGAATGIGPGHGKDDSGGHVRGPGGSCRGVAPWGALSAARPRPAAAFTNVHSLPGQRPCAHPSGGPIGRGVAAPIAPARWLERGVDLRQH